MSERQLPWHVKRPEGVSEYGVGELPDVSRIGYSVWDGAGVFVCVCWGEERGYNEALAICERVNRAGDRTCHNCGDPAACFGSYEDELHPAYSCDECCGHGNEDGHCERIVDADDGESLTPPRKPETER